jgi:gliding motility-associated-like protein
VGGNAYSLVNPTTIRFNPVTSGPGVDSIFYTIGGQCGAQDTLIIGVAADDIAEIDVTSAGPFCQTDAAAQMLITNNSTTGGFWTNGAGVNVNTYISATGEFNPQHSSVSINTPNRVIYHTTGVCPKKDTVDVSVVSVIIADITQNDTLRLCVDGATVPLTLSNTTTPNGTWRATPTNIVSNTGVINPALGTPGTTYKIKYAVYGGTATCADSDSVFVRIIPRMNANIVSFANTVNKDTTVCQGSGSFTLRALNTGGTWSGTGVNATTGVFDPAGLNPGTYTVKHTIQGEGNLCPDEKEVRVVIRPQININLASAMNDVCQGSPEFNLTQSYNPNPATGLWFVMPGNPALAVTNASLGTINPTVAGTYTVHYGIADLCGDTTSVNFTIVETVNPAIANKPTAAVCIGQEIVDFNPVNTTTAGVWTVNNGGTIDASTGSMNIETSGEGTYQITHTITTTGNGVTCPTQDVANLVVQDYLLANINAAGPFCENLSDQQLSVTGATGGTWGGAATNTGVFSPGNFGPGTHEVTYRLQNACDTTYRREIQVSGVPNTDYEIINDNATNCEPLTVTFRDISGSPVNSTRWVLSTGETILANNELEVTFMAGTYYAGMIQDYQNGCKDTLRLSIQNETINVDAVPFADFTWSPIMPNAKDPNVQFENLSNNGSAFEWTFDVRTAIPNFSTEFRPYVSYNAPDGDTTEVCLRVINGSCSADTCKQLIIINNLTVFMPNAFTPNGDGLNDVFYPMGKFHDNPMGSDKYQFWVFNRWGQEIFYTQTPYAGWDGKYLTKDVQQDVYVWRIEVFNPTTNKTETHVGQVTLYR